jgi:hypothetical protein
VTVRVWFTPSDLGECGYFIDFAQADDYERTKVGTLRLMFTSADGEVFECARVQVDRWDAAELLPMEVHR